MTEQRIALLIGNAQFPEEPVLPPLVGPLNDIDQLAGVLRDPKLGGFSVEILPNLPHYKITPRINEACQTVGRDDFLLLYFSGHGKLDSNGQLYLATFDTRIRTLEATSLPLQHIRTMLGNSTCGRIMLVLDCCYSGAVEGAFIQKGTVDDRLQQTAQGRGIFLLTASTSVEIAKELKEEQIGVLTKYLVEGIRTGEPDTSGRGYVTADDLYGYVYKKVIGHGRQEPMKWDLGIKGQLVVSRAGGAALQREREKMRASIRRLALDGMLPEEIEISSLNFIRRVKLEPQLAKTSHYELLKRLIDGDATVGSFIGDWNEIKQFPSAETPHPQNGKVESTPDQPKVKKPVVKTPAVPLAEASMPKDLEQRQSLFDRRWGFILPGWLLATLLSTIVFFATFDNYGRPEHPWADISVLWQLLCIIAGFWLRTKITISRRGARLLMMAALIIVSAWEILLCFGLYISH